MYVCITTQPIFALLALSGSLSLSLSLSLFLSLFISLSLSLLCLFQAKNFYVATSCESSPLE